MRGLILASTPVSMMIVWQGVIVALVAVFAACKPLVRQAVSNISAVSDARLTLGVVPIESSDGMHAYRMLLCKKARVYPSSMLADDNRCRVALLDHNGAEVAFLPNEFKRDFATKYKGYAKKTAVVALAIVPVALAASYAGTWRHARKMTVTKRSVHARLHPEGLGERGWNYYKSAWEFELVQHIKAAKESKNNYSVENEITRIRTSASTLASAAQLRAKKNFIKTVNELKGLPHNKLKYRLNEILKEVSSQLGGSGFYHPRPFSRMKNVAGMRDDFIYNFNGDSLLGRGYTFDGIERVGKDLPNELLWSNEIYYKRDLVQKLESSYKTDEAIEPIYKGIDVSDFDDKANRLLQTIQDDDEKLGHNMLRKGGEKDLGVSRVRDKTETIAGFGAAGLGAAIMLAVDKSIWGYAERQVSEHWNQIFVENDDFKDVQAVKDVKLILQALADEFDFVVNARALQLAD